MVFPQEHVLIRLNGHFGTSTVFADRWSVGMRFGLATSAPAYDAAKLQTFVNAVQTAGNTLHALTSTAAGTNCYLDYVSGAQVGVLGRYTPSSQLTVISPTTTTAGAGTPVAPWNTALVVSLRTARPRGAGSNGRLYYPCLALTPASATGRIATASVVSRLGGFKTFLDACNAAASTYSAGTRLLVASSVGGGIHAVVTSIRSDERLDSIERRENDQSANWSTAALA